MVMVIRLNEMMLLGMAVDWIADNVYWVADDRGGYTINP